MSTGLAQDSRKQAFDVSKIDALPPLPETGMKIMRSFGDEFIDGNLVADIVAGDPAICARLIGIANSSYFNLREPVSDMRAVVNRVLGVDTVRTMAFALAVQRSFDTSRCPNFDSAQFWQRALGLADACQSVALLSNLAADARLLAHTLGLCGGLGLLALAALEPLRLDSVLAVHDVNSADIDHAVAEEFGVSATKITALLAQGWSMPELLVDAYTALATQQPEHAPMSALLLCVNALQSDQPADELPEWLELLGVDADQVQAAATDGASSKDADVAGSLF
ncbi:MAG: HDOD domain-containing protein [Pseudomonadota bacterium]